MFKEWIKQLDLCENLLFNEDESKIWWPREYAEKAFYDPNFRVKFLIKNQVPIQWKMDNQGNKTLNIPEPMTGGVGRAYAFGDYVVKFTTNEEEAQVAYHLKGQDKPYIAKIFDVAKLSEIKKGRPLYAIISEKVYSNAGAIYRAAADAVYNYVDNNPQGITQVDDNLINSIIFKHLNKKYLNDKRKLPLIINAIRDIATTLSEYQNKEGLIYRDMHGGNVGFKKSPKWRTTLFDMGRSQGEIPIKNIPSYSNV